MNKIDELIEKYKELVDSENDILNKIDSGYKGLTEDMHIGLRWAYIKTLQDLEQLKEKEIK